MAEVTSREPLKALTCIDLFCGCGGFTLGMQRAGFRVLAAIDFNEEAVAALKANLGSSNPAGLLPVEHALRKDLTTFTPEKLASKLGVNTVDVIVGGPPCQGFSTVRQVDAANHGSRVKRDKRRYLFRCFLDYVAAFRPKVFVMENVLGIQSAAKGKFFTLVQSEARKLNYRVHPQVEEAWKLGVPQKRRRQLIVGVRDDVPGYFPGDLSPSKRAGGGLAVKAGAPFPMLWDAIGDLPPLVAGGGEELSNYDLAIREQFLADRGPAAERYLENVLEIGLAKALTSHRARPHNDQDLRDFLRLKEGETAGQAIARGEPMEFTYKRTIFLDRYHRQHRDERCSTIVAHLSKDGLGFIHPTQNRSLTPREAARIQSFPDWFSFPATRTHSFRMIGNAVPPLVAEAVGEEIIEFLSAKDQAPAGVQFPEVEAIQGPPVDEEGQTHLTLLPDVEKHVVLFVPSSEAEAVEWLKPLLDIAERAPKELRRVQNEAFQRAWRAIAFLFAGLHPDAALDHGESICRHSEQDYEPIRLLEPRLLAPYYERSGWPVILAPISREAWRRYSKGEMTEEEFYCGEAQLAGMRHRSPTLFQDPPAPTSKEGVS